MPYDTIVFGFFPGLLENTNKYIEVTDGHYVTANQKGNVQIKTCDGNVDNFIATLHSVILDPDICNRLFSIIMLMNSVHTCLFHKGFCMV